MGYFQIQVMRSIDGQPISPAEFGEALQQVEAGIVAAAADVQRQADAQFQRGNQELRERTGSEAELSLSSTKYHGIFRRESWGLFFTLTTQLQVQGPAGTIAKPATAAAGMVLVDRQVVYLYAYALGGDPSGRRWAEQQVSAWADAVLRANNPRPEAAPTTTTGKRL